MCYNCCRESVNVCNDVCVVQKNGTKFNVDGCVLTDKQLIDFQPLSAKSQPLGVFGDIPITESECVDHCYNFEDIIDEMIPDDCGEVNAIINKNIVSLQGPSGGVPNLNKYGQFGAVNDKKLGIDNINFNANGFAISLWFLTNNLSTSQSFVAKGTDTNIQTTILDVQLVGTGKLKFRLKLGNDVNDGTVEFETQDSVVGANIWHHVVYWYDGCEMRIYVDGVKLPLNPGTSIGNGPDNSRPFADFKGQKVFQGDQPVAIGSQPEEGAQDWNGYDGSMDQVIIWNHPISQEVISALYNNRQGSTTIPIEVCSTFADFGTPPNECSHLLRNFTQTLCIKTCFDEGLCCLFTGCESISVFITKNLESESTLVYKASSLSEWPGNIEILDKMEDPSNEFFYTVRLTLDIEKLFGCPIDIKGKSITFTVNNPYSIQKPFNPFTITGMKRKTQKKCC